MLKPHLPPITLGSQNPQSSSCKSLISPTHCRDSAPHPGPDAALEASTPWGGWGGGRAALASAQSGCTEGGNDRKIKAGGEQQNNRCSRGAGGGETRRKTSGEGGTRGGGDDGLLPTNVGSERRQLGGGGRILAVLVKLQEGGIILSSPPSFMPLYEAAEESSRPQSSPCTLLHVTPSWQRVKKRAPLRGECEAEWNRGACQIGSGGGGRRERRGALTPGGGGGGGGGHARGRKPVRECRDTSWCRDKRARIKVSTEKTSDPKCQHTLSLPLS